MKEIKKNERVSEILSIVNLSSLLFSAVAFLQYISTFQNTDRSTSYYWAIGSISGIGLLALVYLVWSFSISKKIKDYRERLPWVEIFVFMIIFMFAIMLSGAEQSNYKFLFLFIIITSTIQGGMERGITVAGISSVIVIGIDLLFFKEPTVNIYFQNDLVMAGVFILTAWPLGYYVKTEKEHIRELQQLVNKDGLTGLYNHRYFYDNLRANISRSEAEKQNISLMFIDIDHFKHYNDVFGHQQGDEVLKTLGEILLEDSRENDIVARYGGEEFSIILPNTNEAEAILVAERLRKKVEDTRFYGQENQPNGNLTVSIGISTYPEKAKDDMDLIKSADDALYRAKFFHKNRVETYVSILDDLRKVTSDKDLELITSIKTLISVINAKDRYTYSHVERVVIYSKLIADKLNLDEDEKKRLIYGAYMHDIGKINIAKEILIKKMPLTNEEWLELKNHPINGVDIINHVDVLKDVAPLILYHHERYDGFGYPAKLKGEEIPYLARILTVVDSFDAMTSNRPYNKRKTYEEGIEELKRCSGSQFDPDVVEQFIEVIREKIGNIEEYGISKLQ